MSTYRSLPIVLAIGLTVGFGMTVRADEQTPQPPAKAAPKAGAPAPAQGHSGPAGQPQGHPGGPAPSQRGGPAQGHPGGPRPEAAHGPGRPGEDHRDMAHERHEFHEHDVHRFNHEDLARWRGGHWHQEWHDGRYGWWWMVGGVWYFYERPIYPYPLVVAEVTYAEPVVVAPVVVPPMPPPAPVVAAPAGPPPQQFWYYCDNPPGYYPYVATCNSNYRAVPIPANPAATNAAAPPPPAH